MGIGETGANSCVTRTLENLVSPSDVTFPDLIFPSGNFSLPDLISSDPIPSDMIPSLELSRMGPYDDGMDDAKVPMASSSSRWEKTLHPDQTKWICRDPSLVGIPHSETPTKPLSECKSCVAKKRYGAYYSAAAHLRRVHFKTKKKPTRRNEENRSGKGGGDWPPMSELKLWMEEVTVLVDVD